MDGSLRARWWLVLTSLPWTLVLIAPGCSSGVPEPSTLRLVDRELIDRDCRERLYSLVFERRGGQHVSAYLRQPVQGDSTAPAGSAYPGVVLVAGRYAGREAAAIIPGPLDHVMLAVEYPQTIPAQIRMWEWVRNLWSIRRSAREMPEILRGAARYLAELPEVDAQRIGLVGVSFGVPFAAVAGEDRIFAAVALHYGGSNLESLFHANISMENRVLRGIAARVAGWWFRELDPGRNVGRISPTPLLLINSIGDDQIPAEAARLLAARANPPVHQIWLPYGHIRSGEMEVIREVADSTFDYFDAVMTRR